MSIIAPGTYFDFDLVRGNSSWASNKVNLAQLVSGLEEYYKAEHGKEFVLDFIDLDRIAQDKDLAHVELLLEFVVGVSERQLAYLILMGGCSWHNTNSPITHVLLSLVGGSSMRRQERIYW
jgi:hypothetical protein